MEPVLEFPAKDLPDPSWPKSTMKITYVALGGAPWQTNKTAKGNTCMPYVGFWADKPWGQHQEVEMDPFVAAPDGNFAFPASPTFLRVARQVRKVGTKSAHELVIWYAQKKGIAFSIAPVLQLACDFNKQPSLDAYISGGTNISWVVQPSDPRADSYAPFVSGGYPVALSI